MAPERRVSRTSSMGRVRAVIGAIGCSIGFVAVAAEPDCEPQTQVDVTKIEQQVILIGESHGTSQIPRFTLGVVCSLLRAGRPVILGVEHSGEQQEALNRYLSSPGTPADRKELLKGVNWRLYCDGRGSVAMFELIESMRRLRQDGQRVGVLAIDRNENLDVPLEESERVHVPPADNAFLNRIGNEAMADNILYAAILYRQYVVVVLSGFSHTSTAYSRSVHPMVMDYKPMGQVLSERIPTFTIGIDSGGGASAFGGKVYPEEPGPLYETETNIGARVRIDRLTPSFPARDTIR